MPDKLEIGTIVNYNGEEYKIVGHDESAPHPAAQYKKWEYILQSVKGSTKTIRVLSCEIH